MEAVVLELGGEEKQFAVISIPYFFRHTQSLFLPA